MDIQSSRGDAERLAGGSPLCSCCRLFAGSEMLHGDRKTCCQLSGPSLPRMPVFSLAERGTVGGEGAEGVQVLRGRQGWEGHGNSAGVRRREAAGASVPVNCPLAQRPESLSGTQSSPIRASRDLATCERVEHLPGPLTSNTHTPSGRTGTENHTKDSHLKKGSVGNTAGPYQFSGAVWQKPEGFRAL